MRRQTWVRAVVLLVLATAGSVAAWWWVAITYRNGIVVAGIPLPARSEAEFASALDQLEKQVLGKALRLEAPGGAWDIVALDWGVRADFTALWERVRGRHLNSRLLRALFNGNSRRGPRLMDLPLVYDPQYLDEQLALIGAAYYWPPRNAHIDPATGAVKDGSLGRELDVPATRGRLMRAWQRGLSTVEAVVRHIPPTTQASDLLDLGETFTLARFSSYFALADDGRVANIRNAAYALDGVVVQPGEEFSFNSVVGPRTTERGFRLAHEIVNQEMVPGVGGGVCQVSSTLYNAVLLAGLKVSARQNHSRPLGYVPIGRDATVYYGVIDFRFVNSLTSPILLTAEVVGSRLSVAVRAPEKPKAQYDLIVSTPEMIPPELVMVEDLAVPSDEVIEDTAGQPGWIVRSWRVTMDPNGVEIGREYLDEDIYPPQPAIARVRPH